MNAGRIVSRHMNLGTLNTAGHIASFIKHIFPTNSTASLPESGAVKTGVRRFYGTSQLQK